MNTMDADDEPSLAAHGKPCIGCRKRKIKCDRLRPCANCTRSKQLCTYDNADSRGESSSAVASDGDVRERLAKLERMMAAMLLKENEGRGHVPDHDEEPLALNSAPSPAIISPSSTFVSPTTTPLNIDLTTSARHIPLSKREAPVGQILFQDGCSAYYDADFWPTLMTEVEDLRILFDQVVLDPPAGHSQGSGSVPWPLLTSSSTSSCLSLMHPTLDQSNVLCKYFFEIIQPFIPVIHQALFARELEQYRRGTYLHPQEFEAVLFTMYLLTINSLQPRVIEEIFSVPKQEVLAKFKHSAQVALSRIDFMRNEKLHGLGALLYYVTFLFQQNLYKDGIALLGIASNLARQMGIHRDPSHFPFSPWVCNIRRRLWNHLCCLDGQAIQFYGAQSCLPAKSDASPPQNANESDWHASRFAKPASAPQDAVGFKDLTFPVVNRAISDTIRDLADTDCKNFEKREEILRRAESFITEKYLSEVDRSNPRHTVVVALMEVRLAGLRLNTRHRQLTRIRTSPADPGRYRTLIAAVELLEAYQYHKTTFSTLNWEWIFQTAIPWLAIAIVLAELPHLSAQSDIARAQRQVDDIFAVFSNPDQPVSNTPMWGILLQLRQNMTTPVQPTSAVALGNMDSMATTMFTDDLMLDLGVSMTGSMPGEFDEYMLGNENSITW
ncbi:hypothetical protein BJ875DRAFT_176798 [Amylocarpus encephaloides]|uniref:Zn(2)-C6 fungal-type domain-containing protein n=1 Tax=Amylocarpus encephaloides TaxID=45428 RepID=A0A9P7Y9H5_9HELO|nr:hypothetical protein BJ875DRAFT_176798 [Amylocarpus encephaloides]